MSLTSILKEIDRLNRKHHQVQLRYNPKIKNCPRQSEIKRQELQDQHIFGYSHSQILGMFRKSKFESAQETRPCTATEARPYTAVFSKTHKGIRRAQSAFKVGGYKQQFNFLFKEDIFDENHQKMRRMDYQKEQNCEDKQKKMSKMLLDKSVPRSVNKMHSKSIRAEKIKFIRSFDQNLAGLQGSKGKKLLKISKNQVYYTRTHNSTAPNSQHTNGEDFFKLTKAAERDQPKRTKVVLSQSVDNIREIESLMNMAESSTLADLTRQSSVGRFPPLLQTNFLSLMPSKFSLTCIAMESLQSIKLKLTVRNGNVALQESTQTINLSYIFEQLLTSNKMVHLVFHSQGALLYQETLVGHSYRNMQGKEHEIQLLMYYLKRFLLLDTNSTLKQVRQSADLLLKSNIDLPDSFQGFTQTFKGKLCRVYDSEQRLYQFSLMNVLSNALSSVASFKKQMGFGQKMVKLKHGTREQFKKYLQNWQYFYI